MPSKKTAAELRLENKILRQSRIVESVTTIVTTGLKCAMLVLIFRYLYLSIDVLAGKTTVASVLLNFLGSLTVSKTLAYLFGGTGVVYGIAERQVRRKTIKRIGGRIKLLEMMIDPDRSSSGLTDKGDPAPPPTPTPLLKGAKKHGK